MTRAAPHRLRLSSPAPARTASCNLPPERALCGQERGHGRERAAEGAREAVPEGEVAEREDEGEADRAPEDAVGPFHVVDRLEIVELYARVEPVTERGRSREQGRRDTVVRWKGRWLGKTERKHAQTELRRRLVLLKLVLPFGE